MQQNWGGYEKDTRSNTKSNYSEKCKRQSTKRRVQKTMEPETYTTDDGVEHVKSPCVNVCLIDTRTDLCMGCYRTIHEIMIWQKMSNDDKRATLRSIENERTTRAI